MNTPHDHDAGDRDAREWAVQERARRHARDVEAPSGAPECGSGFSRDFFRTMGPSSSSPPEAADVSYQHIAEALRHPPPVDLPADFADRVARVAEARAPASVLKSSRLKPLPRSDSFERALVRVFVPVFALCGVAAGLVYGERVLMQLQATVGVQGLQWAALAAACLGLSWALDWLRRRLGHGDAMPAA